MQARPSRPSNSSVRNSRVIRPSTTKVRLLRRNSSLDLFGPLLDAAEVAGARVADIGSGTGRVVNWLLDLGASHVTAVEPSSSFEVLKANTAARADSHLLHQRARRGAPARRLRSCILGRRPDEHPRSDPVVARIFAALRPGGRFLAWLYAYEGNEIYLAFARPMRARHDAPPRSGSRCSLACLRRRAVALHRALPMAARGPRHHHFREVMSRMTWRQRVLVIFDQLNPTWAEYYRRAEVERLIAKAGFEDVRLRSPARLCLGGERHQAGRVQVGAERGWTIVSDSPATRR